MIALHPDPALPRSTAGSGGRVAVLSAVVAAVVLAGCGLPGPPAPSPAPTPPATAPAAAVGLPWPVAGAVDTGALQDSVDGGAQPWLVDPAEVALSYVAAAHGWDGAAASPRTPGSARVLVDVRAGTDHVVLTLGQPGRTGPGGIWVVTAESPA